MQEFSSVTASSYDAESLAPMLTEKAGEGWSVVGIVSAGTNVVAYLSRGGAVTSSDSAVAAVAPVAESDDAGIGYAGEPTTLDHGTTEEPAAADVTAEPPVPAQSWETVDVADSGFVVADDATAITPTLPEESVAPVAEAAPTYATESSGEAAAAVVATGEPVGWGASADAVADAAAHAGSEVGGQVEAGASAATGGVADTVGGYATGASDVLGGVGEQTGAVVGGMADTATSAGSSDAGVGAVGAATEQTPAAETVVEAVPESSGVPAGWYADPSGRFELRYWDGNAWTEHVSRAGQQYTDPPVA
jgi:Protein of unknown function (DUF2510)